MENLKKWSNTLLFGLACASHTAPAVEPPTASMKLLVARDYVEVHLLLPAAVVPDRYHGTPPEEGTAPQPPYVSLLENADGYIVFPVESKCHSDGASIVRVAHGVDASGAPLEDLDNPPPPVPVDGTLLSGVFEFHCDALKQRGLEWVGFELFNAFPALDAVEVTVLERDPPLELRLDREWRRIVLVEPPAQKAD
jgi:hypothetical protein